MTRSRRWVAPAALGLASMCLLAPAAAYHPADEDPVELSSDVAEAPVVEPGVHSLVLPAADQASFVKVERKMPGSTVWFGQTYLSETLENQWVSMRVPDGKGNCPYTDFEGSDYHRHRFVTGVLGVDTTCQDSDTVTMEETPPSNYQAAGEEAELAVWEEPPVENRDVLPPPALEHPWDKEEVPAEGAAELGTTYADAPELTGGRWDVHVDPGQPALFRADLDWNQHLQVGFTYEGKEAGDALIYPILISPLGGYSEWGSATDAPGSETVLTSLPGSEGSVVSPSISWRNREATDVTAAFPGTYYVMLRLGTLDAPKNGADLSVSVKVITDKEAESPYAAEHQDTEAALPPDIGGHRDAEEGTGSSSESSSSTASTPWPAVGGLGAGSVVMAVVGGVFLARYRRSVV